MQRFSPRQNLPVGVGMPRRYRVLHPRRRLQTLTTEEGQGGRSMDYIIAGIASVLLFIYLIYALLKPERF